MAPQLLLPLQVFESDSKSKTILQPYGDRMICGLLKATQHSKSFRRTRFARLHAPRTRGRCRCRGILAAIAIPIIGNTHCASTPEVLGKCLTGAIQSSSATRPSSTAAFTTQRCSGNRHYYRCKARRLRRCTHLLGRLCARWPGHSPSGKAASSLGGNVTLHLHPGGLVQATVGPVNPITLTLTYRVTCPRKRSRCPTMGGSMSLRKSRRNATTVVSPSSRPWWRSSS